MCYASFHYHASQLFTLDSQLTLHGLPHDAWVLTQNQDQDTGSPESIFADLFWMFVGDSSAKYIKE